MGPAEVEQVSERQAPAGWQEKDSGYQICYSLEEALSLDLGGCGGKWLVQPGLAESEKDL